MADVIEYNAEQRSHLHLLRTALQDITPEQQSFCEDACLYRYLRARSWDVRKAEKQLRETLKWREHYRPQAIKFLDVEHEACTGKVYRDGFDKFGHPVLILRPACQNTTDKVMQMKLLVYMLERCVESMGSGVEKLVMVTDFKGYSRKNAPDLSQSKETLHILSTHYPERLFRAISVDPPLMFWAFFKIIKPFIDPVTAQKVMFAPDGKSKKKEESYAHLWDILIKAETDKALHGDADRPYNPEQYRRQELLNDVRKGLLTPDDLSAELKQIAKDLTVSAIAGAANMLVHLVNPNAPPLH
mmetsp:Transcript_15404/g.26454  ORF Transcript_15404/g.26454 Transcript_15404/m.26454 type:complete len:300 (+) Transcript_15404:51-950(+)|eukprot:CAMPEP_0196656190 /NCGR_PEP_ID=MMETSP1086-20130531/13645_1 /TAXON_ID=77921 /ORGANISM="Cyanoptyche  gloeocystis , Strain SAG4.97" /LENGTH=299 /DNA_ID=CAMNT_0041988825 /DNA_START=51 /DNA_END=950 /DNA_ORIENTATION=+